MISCQVEMMNILPVFIEVVEMLQDVLPDVPCHCTLLEQTVGPSNVLRQQHILGRWLLIHVTVLKGSWLDGIC